MKIYSYNVRCNKDCLKILAKRLIFCMIPFHYTGGITISFDVTEDELKWLKGTFETIKKKSKKEYAVCEIDNYNTRNFE